MNYGNFSLIFHPYKKSTREGVPEISTNRLRIG